MRCDASFPTRWPRDQDVQAYTERPLTDDENALLRSPTGAWRGGLADWADAAR